MPEQGHCRHARGLIGGPDPMGPLCSFRRPSNPTVHGRVPPGWSIRFARSATSLTRRLPESARAVGCLGSVAPVAPGCQVPGPGAFVSLSLPLGALAGACPDSVLARRWVLPRSPLAGSRPCVQALGAPCVAVLVLACLVDRPCVPARLAVLGLGRLCAPGPCPPVGRCECRASEM